TSSVDPKTDALIQSILRREFNFCTVVTIAHRLKTVLDYDKVRSSARSAVFTFHGGCFSTFILRQIACMDRGRLTEFGSPAELLSRPNGVFAQMIEQMNSGQGEATTLHPDH